MITESAVAICAERQIKYPHCRYSRDRVGAWHFFLFFLFVCFLRAAHYFFNTPFLSSFCHKILKTCLTRIHVLCYVPKPVPLSFHGCISSVNSNWPFMICIYTFGISIIITCLFFPCVCCPLSLVPLRDPCYTVNHNT